MVGRASVRRARHKQKLESKDIRHWKAKKPLRYSLNASKYNTEINILESTNIQ